MTENNLVLVTGANGFIGRNLCNRLRAGGIRIRALLRTESAGPWDETVIADLEQGPLPPECMAGVDTVFHLAGKVHAVDEVKGAELPYQRINVEGTRMLLDAAGIANVGQFIFFSSVKALGEGDEEPLDDDSKPAPVTYYGKSKLQAEELVMGMRKISKVTVIRPAMVYGPGNPGNLSRMITAIQKGYFPPWPRLDNRRSMVHVDDLVAAAMLVQRDARAGGQAFIVTDGQYYSTRQIYEWICTSLGASIQGWVLPYFLLRSLALMGDVFGAIFGRSLPFNSSTLAKLAGSSAYDSAKIRKTLGFIAEKSMESTIDEIVKNMRR